MPGKAIYTNDSIYHFEAIFTNATLSILVTRDSGEIIAVNPFALKEFGYKAEELIGRRAQTLLPAHYHKNFIMKSQGRPMEEGEDLYAIRKDGSEFPAKISQSYYSNGDNKYVVSFINNISVRKNAEAGIEKLNDELEATVVQRTKDLTEVLQQLKISNHQLEKIQAFQKAILDNAGAMIIATDGNGLITFFNNEASLSTGYDEEEVINKTTPLLFHDKREIDKRRHELSEEFGEIIEDDFAVLVAKAKRGTHEEEEFTYIRRDKTSFPVSLTITAVKDNDEKIIGFMGVAIDVAERRKAEDELRRIKKLFLQLLRNYPDGIISIIDDKYKFVFTGGELHGRLGTDQEKLLGADIYPNFGESLRDFIIAKVSNVFLTGNTVPNLELPYTITGETYMMDAFPLVEGNGSVNRVGVIIRNISGLKKTEEGLRDALEKERELGELKSRFVSMASHEFRTPLSTVLSSSYLIGKYNTTEEQPKREKHLQRIVSSVGLLTEILNDFLSLGKIEEGKIQVKFSDFSIKEMVNETIKEMDQSIKKDQEISYKHQGSAEVFLDSSLLKFIIMNLVSNASKFSSEGASIEIKTVNENQCILLSVKDHGIGISKPDQQHLMERFFRGDNATNIQGTGLGLHIVAKYTELMNGTIEWKSELEEGTEFIITFKSEGSQHEKNTFDRRQ